MENLEIVPSVKHLNIYSIGKLKIKYLNNIYIINHYFDTI